MPPIAMIFCMSTVARVEAAERCPVYKVAGASCIMSHLDMRVPNKILGRLLLVWG